MITVGKIRHLEQLKDLAPFTLYEACNTVIYHLKDGYYTLTPHDQRHSNLTKHIVIPKERGFKCHALGGNQ